MGPAFLTKKAGSRGLQKVSASHVLCWEEWCWWWGFFPFAREVSCWWFLLHSGFTLGCFHVFWHRFAPCSLLMSATSYYIQILYGNCFTDIRCFFFALFVTPKASFVQLDMSISLTDHWWIVCIPEDSSATLWPLSYHPHACTPLHCILCSHCYHTIPVLLYLYIVMLVW